MAGISWIKLETTLPRKPAVYAVADACGVNENEALGAIVSLLCWADGMTADGVLTACTLSTVDRITGLKGLGAALVTAGWLVEDHQAHTVAFLEWETHNGESAKQRALTARRVAKHKAAKQGGNADGVSKVTPTTLAERYLDKNRKDTKVSYSNAPAGACESDDAFTLSFLAAYGRQPRNKVEFQAAFAAARKNVSPDILCKCASAYIAALRAQDGSTRYQLTPERWLADQRYNDYISAARACTIPGNSVKFKRPFYGQETKN